MSWINRCIAVLDRVNSAVLFAFKHLALTLVAVMTLIVLAQVFTRLTDNYQPWWDALTWSEEVARMMMIWMTFLVAPIAYRAGTNVSIELLQQMIHGRARGLLELVLNVLVLGFVVVFFNESLGLVERGLKLKASTVDIQMFWIYLIMPISMTVMFSVGIERLLKDIRVLIDPGFEDTIAQSSIPSGPPSE